MALPLLPGYVFDKNVGKEKFHLSQIFQTKNGIGYLFNDDKPGVGGEPLPGQRIDAPRSSFPKGNGEMVPAFVAFDKVALQFDAYFQEGVHERREERYRIRNVKIQFFPEDDTIQIIEPRIKNSGIPQGTILKRRRVSKPAPFDHLFYTVHDLNVGKEIDIYGRRYRINNCDAYTSRFLSKLGVRVGLPEGSPNDPYSTLRLQFENSMTPRRPYEKIHKEKQFLANDRRVLRFYCTWDDTGSMYGEVRKLRLHYYLSDDTIEIIEDVPPNSGRETKSVFLRRSKCPKGTQPLPLPGSEAERTVLNVMADNNSTKKGVGVLIDNLKLGQQNIEYYTDRDLKVKGILDIFGRKVVIDCCDEFTRKYYQERYGIDQFYGPRDPIVPVVEMNYPNEDPCPCSEDDKICYPYNGWGSYEDSLANCQCLMAKPPKKDFKRFLFFDRDGLASNEFRFLAKIISDDPLDQERRFVLSCFLVDGSIMIQEASSPYSEEGKRYLERRMIPKPDQHKYNIEVPKYYQPTDLYVGCILKILGREFLLFDADEYVYKYMEEHCDAFPNSDVKRIVWKLRKCACKSEEFAQFCESVDQEKSGFISFDQLATYLDSMVDACPDLTLNTHEMITLARAFQHKAANKVNKDRLFGLARHHLKKTGFNEYKRLLNQLMYEDQHCTKTLCRSTMNRVLKPYKMRFPEPMLEEILDQCAEDPLHKETIKYFDFMKGVDWSDYNNQMYDYPDFSGNLELCWRELASEQPKKTVQNKKDSMSYQFPVKAIDYAELINSIKYAEM